jgi:restriction system protein
MLPMRVVVWNILKASKQFIFTKEQVSTIITAIEAGRLSRGLKTNLAHNQHVKQIVKTKSTKQVLIKETTENMPDNTIESSIENTAEKAIKENKSVDPSCPKCGSEMKLREVKKGKNAGNKFWGCCNFPQCRKVLSVS